MVQPNKCESAEKWSRTKLVTLQQNLDQCSNELLSQSLSCPKTFSIQYVDSRLEEFVRLHHLDMIRKINYRINKFKDDIREKQRHADLYSKSLTTDQVKYY